MGREAADEASIPLDVPYAHLHRDWHGDWCSSIRSSANREAIARNPRLARRPAADLARQNGLLPAARAGAAASFSDVVACHIAVSHPERFRRVLGLAVLAPAIATEIDPETVRQLRAQFDAADLRLALATRAEGDQAEAVPFAMSRITSLVEAEGQALLREWMAGLPPALEGRIRLTLPKGETVAALTPASAPRRRLVHEVARLILAETSDEAKQ
jgi:hypothetical protein